MDLFELDDWDSPNIITPTPTPVAWLGSAVVFGPAQTQGSKRAFIHPHLTRNGKPVAVVVDTNDKALKSWRQELIKAMMRTKPPKPLDSPVAMRMIVYVSRPRTHYRSNGELKPNAPKLPASGLDGDKVVRAIFDAAQIAGWFVNDARVVDHHMRRRFDDGIGERVWCWCWQVSEPDQPQPELPEIIDIGEGG